MKYTFYRPSKINTKEFDEIIANMHKDLIRISKGYVREKELKNYLVNLVRDQKDLINDPRMGFWGLEEPEKMPSDIRVLYFYTPTYIATGILINAKLNYPEISNEIEGYDQALIKGLLASTGRGFAGHGHDSLDGLIDALNIFILAKAHIFIELFPDYCQEFTNLLNETLIHCEQRIITNKIKGDWREDYSTKLNCLLQGANPNGYIRLNKMKEARKVYLYVYGTLMSTNISNKTYLDDAEYLGKYTLSGYKQYDLDSYPGIVKGNDMVKGELYAVSLDRLADIDQYEGEGSLYKRKMVQVYSESNEKYNAFTYIYNRPVTGMTKINYEIQPWYNGIAESLNNNLVWYACYGSNINKERFMKYINGDKLANREICRKGCSDKTPPRDEKPYIFDYPIYFSNNSSNWDNKGVAFLDINKSGKSYGKMYLITREQFEEIQDQEGRSSEWYGKTVSLGNIDGIEVRTITKEKRTCDVIPSTKYLEVIRKGIHETYPDKTLLDIDLYLTKSYLNEDYIDILRYIRNQAHGVSIEKITKNLNLKNESVVNGIGDLKECGFIKHDGRSVAANIRWCDQEAIYYTMSGKREMIDMLLNKK